MKFLICFFFVFGIYASPFPLQGEWELKWGNHTSESSDTGEWTKSDSFPLNSGLLSNTPESKFIGFTAKKKFELDLGIFDGETDSLSILLPYVTNIYVLFINGKELSRKGEIVQDQIIKNGISTNRVVKIPPDLLRQGENQIRIFVAGHRDEELAIYGGDLFCIDTYFNNMHKKSEYIDMMLLFLYAFVGFYHLLLFSKRTKEKYNFYFGSYCVLLAIYLIARSNMIHEYILEPLNVIKIEYPTLFIAGTFYVLFFEDFLLWKITLYGKITSVLFTIISFLVLFSTKQQAGTILSLAQLYMLPALLYTLYLMIRSVMKKHEDAFRMLLGFLILIICIFSDLIGAMKLIPHWDNHGFTKYGFFSFIIGIAVVLANKFLRVHAQVEELNASLERKVQERTEQLSKSLREVQDLKFQQDGDYFLTSLLIKPLMVNQVQSESISVEFFIKQKKSFDFKGKTVEIGGDICIANKINLMGRNYCIFINGDAMGKSIQGAGGALVLGVVFRSVIARTQQEPMDLPPEVWIKNCFVELQNVFVSFDGSMLISVVMGLVDEKSGMMYFLNAEHPFTVLYRDNKASFLENELNLHKIGMVGLDGKLRVQTFHLEVGDSIIIGSDGRDDVLMGTDSNNQRVINEDETRFLRHVENGSGDLNKINESILKDGKLTDDFTLLRVSFHPSQSQLNVEKMNALFQSLHHAVETKNSPEFLKISGEILELDPGNKQVLKKLIKVYFDKKDYKNSEKYLSYYVEYHPEDNDYYFLYSYILKLNKKYDISAKYGEALRLRDYSNIKNLINLSDSYRLSQRIDRAKKIILEGVNLYPDHKKARELSQLIESYQGRLSSTESPVGEFTEEDILL